MLSGKLRESVGECGKKRVKASPSTGSASVRQLRDKRHKGPHASCYTQCSSNGPLVCGSGDASSCLLAHALHSCATKLRVSVLNLLKSSGCSSQQEKVKLALEDTGGRCHRFAGSGKLFRASCRDVRHAIRVAVLALSVPGQDLVSYTYYI